MRVHTGLLVAMSAAVLVITGIPARADIVGSIFLTGHDPDFHASAGGNSVG